MSELSSLELILWTAAIAGTAWVLIPPVATALGIVLIRYDADDDPASALPDGDDPDFEHRYRQLLALGFKPAGAVTENAWLYLIHWRKSFRVHCLAAPDGRCFAALFRIADGEPVRVVLKTFLSGGGMVTTAMPGVGFEQAVETSLRIEMKDVEPAELLDRHREHAGHFACQRGLDIVRETLAGYAAIDEAHDRRTLCGPSRFASLVLPAVFFAVPAGLALLGWQYAGDGLESAYAMPAALCFGALVYAAVVTGAVPHLVRASCDEDHQPGTERQRGGDC